MKKILLLLLLLPVLAFGQATGKDFANFPTSGSLGSAATTVDVYSRININQTTPSITLTVPIPTNTSTKVVEVWITNKGTVPYRLIALPDTSSFEVDTAKFVILKWIGDKYAVNGDEQNTEFNLIAEAPLSYINDTLKVDTTKVPYFSGGISGPKNSSTYLNGVGVWDTISTGTLQTDYDNSGVPQILTDATRGALTIQRGSASDTDSVLVVKNGAGETTFSISGDGVISSPKEVGVIYSEAFAASTLTNNYTINAGTTTSVTAGTSINLSGGTGLRNRGIVLKNFLTASDRMEFDLSVKLNSVGNSGFAVSLNDPTSLGEYVDIWIDPTTAASTVLKVSVNGTLLSGIVSSAQNLNCTTNDIIDLRVKFSESILTVYASNSSSTVSQTIEFRQTLPNYSRTLGNVWLQTLGGSQSITKFNFIDNNTFNADYIYIGDSNAHGYGCDDLYYRATNVLKRDYGVSIVNFSAVGALQSDFNKTEVFNILNKYKCRNIILQIGCNAPTNTSAYDSLVNRCVSNGYNLILLNLPDRSGVTSSINSFNSFQKSTYSTTYPIIDINTLLGAYTNDQYFTSDGIHYKYSGDNVIANAIANKIKSKYDNNVAASIQNYTPITVIPGMGLNFGLSSTFTTSSTSLSTTTTLTGFPSQGYLMLFKPSTSTNEIVKYSSRTANSFDNITRALFGTTALSIASTSDISCSLISEIKAKSISSIPQKLEYGVGYLSSIWGAGVPKAAADQFMFNTAATRQIRMHGEGDLQIKLSKASSSFSTILWFSQYSGTTESNPFFIRHDASSNLHLATGGANYVWNTDASRNFCIGMNSTVYRLTNAGADATAQVFIDPARSLTSGFGFAFDATNGYVFTQANGTRRIGSAYMKLINTTTTAGSEATDLGIYTQTAGAAPALRATVNSTGISTIHLQGSSSTPTIAAGTGAGTTPTVTVTGTDMGGYITVITGTTPTLSATVATVTFNVPYGSAPRCIQLTSANGTTALLSGTGTVYVDQAGITTTTFALTVGSTALTDATTYKWYYSVIQ